MEPANPTSLVIAIVDQGVEPDTMAVLRERGIEHYTQLSDVAGVGETGPRAGNPIWPGLNTVLFMVLPTEQVQPLIDRLHQVRDSFLVTPGMKFIVTPAEIL